MTALSLTPNFTDLSKEFKISSLGSLHISQSVAIRMLSTPYEMVDPFSLSGLLKKPLAAFSDTESIKVRILDKNLDVTRGFLDINTFLSRLDVSSPGCELRRAISSILALKGLKVSKGLDTEACHKLRALECRVELAFAKSLGFPTGYIYLVELDGCLKMGYSGDPEQRINSYKISSYKVNTIKIVKGNKISEQYLHRFLYSCSEKYDKSREFEVVEAMERVEFSSKLIIKYSPYAGASPYARRG